MKRFVMLWALTHALAGCATERLYVRVLDDEGNPVTNGIVRVGFSTSHVLFGGGNSTTQIKSLVMRKAVPTKTVTL